MLTKAQENRELEQREKWGEFITIIARWVLLRPQARPDREKVIEREYGNAIGHDDDDDNVGEAAAGRGRRAGSRAGASIPKARITVVDTVTSGRARCCCCYRFSRNLVVYFSLLIFTPVSIVCSVTNDSIC